MNRTLESRLGKLETKSGIHDADQLFLMWCRPDQNEDKVLLKAAREGLVDLEAGKGLWPGGRAICCHWISDNPMPDPRWTTIETMDHEGPIAVVIERVDDLAGTAAELVLSSLVKACLDNGIKVTGSFSSRI